MHTNVKNIIHYFGILLAFTGGKHVQITIDNNFIKIIRIIRL